MNRQRSKFFSSKIVLLSLGVAIMFLPSFCVAGVLISEIMYDPKDTDANSGGEWIEIFNDDSNPIDLTKWIFFENETNHSITADGGAEVPAGGYAVISRDLTAFRNFFSNYSGLLFKASFSLNDSEPLAIKSGKESPVTDAVTYTSDWGGKNDGNSLQRTASNSWIATTPTPGALNASVAYTPPPQTPSSESQATTSSPSPSPSSSSSSTSSSSSVTPTVASGSVSRVPVEPQIFAYINGEKSALTGVETIFKGSVFGLDKKPIENARYVWTFGDGTSREGQSVSHAWRLAGSYMVVLEVGSGEFNASARQRIDVVPANVKIEKVEVGEGGFIALKNNMGVDVDLSRWILRSAGQSFILPAHTIILSGATLPFPNSITGLRPDPKSVDLLFPNGLLANNFYQNENSSKVVAVAPVPKKENALAQDAPKIALAEKIVPKDDENNLSKEDTVKQDFSVASTTVLYASAGKSGFSFDWIYALAGIIGIGVIGMLSYLRGDKESILKAQNGVFSPKKLISGDLPVEGKKPPKAEDFEIIEEE